MLHIVRFLLQNGARPSINHTRNSALACVLRHVTDWEFRYNLGNGDSVNVVIVCMFSRYDLLDMLLQEGGDPNVEGRDGSVPLMVCLVPLVNRDHLHHFTHTMKVCFLNCVRILCRYGANPNCSSRSNLTPLHVLNFTATENISLTREEDKAAGFDFVRKLLTLLLQHGLDPNVRFSRRSNHILLKLMDIVQNARAPHDLQYVYDLTLTLVQYGANPNVNVDDPRDDDDYGDSGDEPPSPVPVLRNLSGMPVALRSAYCVSPKNLVLYHYIQMLMKKEALWINDTEMHFAKIIRLYYMVNK